MAKTYVVQKWSVKESRWLSYQKTRGCIAYMQFAEATAVAKKYTAGVKKSFYVRVVSMQEPHNYKQEVASVA